MIEVIKPRPLAVGDTIGVIAPASGPNKEKAHHAKGFLEGMGFKVQFGQSLERAHGYLAGTDQERTDELHQMFADPDIKGIFCVCGGYGTPRIADRLDYELIRSNPKVFWGYSDITFLHVALLQHAGLVTFHGPMLSSDLGDHNVHPLTKGTFAQLIKPTTLTYSEEVRPLTPLVEGVAGGIIVGGNLTLLQSTLGTPYEINTMDKLLFIEEIEEEPYRIDRMLNQLRMAGKFRDAAGIIICDFNNCTPTKGKPSLSLDEVFNDHIVSAGKPTLRGFSIGHSSPNLAIPIGVHARLDTYTKTLTIVDSGVEGQLLH
jgi:muramoyltetrapeptide carboxypeptidase